MNDLKKTYYLNEILRMKRGNSQGVPVNAKPLFVLTLIDSIGNRLIEQNVFSYPIRQVELLYNDISISYEPWRKISPFILPFFHMSKESYYHINWKGKIFIPSSHAHSPSGKYLRDHVNYAYLDQDLWDLLQDYNVREEFRNLLINFFIKHN